MHQPAFLGTGAQDQGQFLSNPFETRSKSAPPDKSADPKLMSNELEKPQPTTDNLFKHLNNQLPSSIFSNKKTAGSGFGQSISPGRNPFGTERKPSPVHDLRAQSLAESGSEQPKSSVSSPFGQSPKLTTSTSLFGQLPLPTTPTSLFGQPAKPATSTSLFGQPAKPATSTSLFGQSTTQTATSKLFGGSDKSNSPFGPSNPITTSNPFGASNQVSPLGRVETPKGTTSKPLDDRQPGGNDGLDSKSKGTHTPDPLYHEPSNVYTEKDYSGSSVFQTEPWDLNSTLSFEVGFPQPFF